MHDLQIYFIIIIIIIIINFLGFACVKFMFFDDMDWCSLRVIYDYMRPILWRIIS